MRSPAVRIGDLMYREDGWGDFNTGLSAPFARRAAYAFYLSSLYAFHIGGMTLIWASGLPNAACEYTLGPSG